MSKKAEFDQFAAKYRDLHAENISASGEDPEYFAAYKMNDFDSVVRAARAPQSGVYLDFGSGVGTSVIHFRRLFPAASLLCADVSSQSLDQARKLHCEGVEFALIEDGRVPAESNSIDGAFACCVFHHIPPQEHANCLTELRRVLRPGAPLMIYEHNPFNPLTVKAVRTCALDANAILLRAGRMRSLVSEAGFAEAEICYRVFFPKRLAALRGLEKCLTPLPLGAQYYVKALA